MMKILVLGALSVASLHFAQSYPASAIPENLKKNANVVIRKDFTTAQINKIDQIKYLNGIVRIRISNQMS